MEIIFGAVGTVLVMGAAGVGFFLGQRHCEQERTRQRANAQKELSLQEKQLMREEAEAFSALMGYNADIAYGITEAFSRRDELAEG